MARKPTYSELEKKLKSLEKETVTFKQAKRNLKRTLAKKRGSHDVHSEPEMAVEVIEQADAEKQPVEQITSA